MGGTGRYRQIARRTALLLAGSGMLLVAGCGSSGKATTPAESLRREDLTLVARALAAVRAPVDTEVAASKAAWPLVVNGLPARIATLPQAPIRAAIETSARLPLPALFDERTAESITGPASSMGGLYRAYYGLASRGWRMIGADIAEIEHGSPAGARFARATVDLYIESVYDAHFSIAQLGKQLLAAYEKLGGPAGFGSSLTQAEVDALATTYSEPSDRLQPHVGVKLGS